MAGTSVSGSHKINCPLSPEALTKQNPFQCTPDPGPRKFLKCAALDFRPFLGCTTQQRNFCIGDVNFAPVVIFSPADHHRWAEAVLASPFSECLNKTRLSRSSFRVYPKTGPPGGYSWPPRTVKCEGSVRQGGREGLRNLLRLPGPVVFRRRGGTRRHERSGTRSFLDGADLRRIKCRIGRASGGPPRRDPDAPGFQSGSSWVRLVLKALKGFRFETSRLDSAANRGTPIDRRWKDTS